MKPITEYFDYQEFLRDYYNAKKQDNPYFSYRFFAGRLGVDPGFLLKVLQGKHHLAERSVQSVCRFMKFDKRCSDYFELLIRYAKAKTPSEIKLHFERLLQLRGPKSAAVHERQYEFYRKWYHSAIHALLSIYPCRGDFAELASLVRPSITSRQARDSIELLVRLGLARHDTDGVYRPTDAFLTSGEKWRNAAIHEFQRETIELSAKALDEVAHDLRDISTVTVALSSKDLPEIRERIRQLRHSILTLENENDPDTVFQINIQVIPVTRTVRGAP
jgi:uncharacterized protein (TIGR02147 family)